MNRCFDVLCVQCVLVKVWVSAEEFELMCVQHLVILTHSFIQRLTNQKMVSQGCGLVNGLQSLWKTGCRANPLPDDEARFQLFLYPASDGFIHLCCSVSF